VVSSRLGPVDAGVHGRSYGACSVN